MDAPMPPQVGPAWDRFMELNRDLESGRDVYPEIFENGWLFPLQRMRETAKMIAMARTIYPKTVMEIGSDKGGSFFHWVKGLRPSKAIAIEIRGIPFAESFRTAFPKTEFYFAGGASSYEPAQVRAVRMFLDEEKIDCLFIDGDKSAVDKDFAAYLPMMRNGGLVFIHDIVDDIEPRRVFNRLKAQYKTQQIVDTSEYDAIEARELEGLTIATAYEGWFRVWKRTSCGVGVVYV